MSRPGLLRFHLSSSPLRIENIVESYESVDKQVSWSKFTTNPDVDSSAMANSIPRPSPHRTSKPLPSILKRKSQMTETQRNGDANSFEISVVRYRTSCCKSVVCLEQISDWISETNVHRCPSCMLLCDLEPLSAPPVFSHSQSLFPATLSLGFEFDCLLSVVRALFQHAKVNYPGSSLPSKSPPDSTYRLFDTDDETYPETEFSRVLSSSLFTTDVKETSVRLLSIVGLTLVLLALLSQ